MRDVPLDEAEAEFRALVAAAREGARFSLIEGLVPQARLLPPARRRDGRDLDFLSLKRHLAGCGGLGRPRQWRRSDIYRRRAP